MVIKTDAWDLYSPAEVTFSGRLTESLLDLFLCLLLLRWCLLLIALEKGDSVDAGGLDLTKSCCCCC